MNDKPARQIGTQALLTAFAFALVVFVASASVLVYQNFELSRRLDSVIESQAQIKAQVRELQKEVDRLNSFFAPESIKKMSLRLKRFGHVEYWQANYYAALIYVYCNKNGLDPFLVYSVIQTESHFVPEAVSSKGARGLMQVMPVWSAAFGICADDLFHPAINIRVGTSILSGELERLRNLHKALAVYNSGTSQEKGKYVKKVMDIYRML